MATERTYFSLEEITTQSIENVAKIVVNQTHLQALLNTFERIFDYYIPLVLLPLGLFGNVMLFLVMILPHNRKHPQCIYMAGLSVVDFLITSCGLFTYWLFFNILSPSDLYPGICPILSYVMHALMQISAFILVLVTLDRLLSIRYSLKFGKFSTPKRTLFMIGLVIIFILLINVHALWTYRFTKVPGSGVFCIIAKPKWWSVANDWFIVVIASCIPFVALLVMNIMLIFTVTGSQVVGESIDQKKRALKQRQITRTLLTVSFAFLLLGAPYRISIMIWKYIDVGDDVILNAVRLFLRRLLHKMWYMNNCVNFYLYVITGGAKFRQDALNLICRRCRRQDNSRTGSNFSQVRERTISRPKENALSTQL